MRTCLVTSQGRNPMLVTSPPARQQHSAAVNGRAVQHSPTGRVDAWYFGYTDADHSIFADLEGSS